MIVYDVTDPESFENVRNWMLEVDKLSNDTVCKVIIGNKCDKDSDRKVTLQQGMELAKHYDVPFFETSAKSALNVEEVFSTITKSIHEKLQKLPQAQSAGKSKLKKGSSIQDQAKGGCC